jgi:type IV secretory pathway VirB4 component
MINLLQRTKTIHDASTDDQPLAAITAPDAVEVAARSVRVGDEVCATLAVAGYPAEVGPGWLQPLLAYPGRLDVSLQIKPVPAVIAAERLRKQRARLESTRRADATKGKLQDPDVDAAAEDAADLANRLARGETRLFRVGLYLTVHATDEDELDERVTEVRALAGSLLLDVVPVTWRQLQGWITGSLPLGIDALGMRRTFDTEALAAAFPFASPDLPAAGSTGSGVLFGLNLSSPGVVVWDRWSLDNYNTVVLARSGAGKSYLAKLDLLRNLYAGVVGFVIDPEDEYLALAEAVGGTIIRPGTPGVRINPLDISSDDGDDGLTSRALFVHTFLSVLLGDLSPDESAALDAAVLAAYRAKGITADPRTWRRPAPLLADLTEALRGQGPHGRALAGQLTPYVTGFHRGLFDGPTTVRPEGHLVVYATRDLPPELRPVGTLLTLDAIWRRVAATGPAVRKLVLVDEAWLTLRTGLGAEFLLRAAKSFRKYGAGLTVVTQDAADVLGSDVGRAVCSNAATQILLHQAPQAIDAVADAFGFTDGEKAFVATAAKGEALLAGGCNARVAFRAVASPHEHHLVVSGPPEPMP